MFDIRVGEKVLIAGLPYDSEYNLVNNKIGKIVNVTAINNEITIYFIARVLIDEKLIADINFDYIYKIPKKKQKTKYINYYSEYFKDHQIIEYDIFVDSQLQHNILGYDRYGGMKFYITSAIN